MTLDLALVTHRPEGILRVEEMLLPPLPGVRYIVSWQAHEDAPVPQALSSRPDVEIHRLDKKGISNNRNNALGHCTADIVLFADDDLQYTPEKLQKVIQTFEDMPDVDVALFKVAFNPPKPYPSQSAKLTLPFPKGYWVSSVEIALRRATAGHLRCNPELGLGAPGLQSGEDEMLVISAIRHGLCCRFVNEEICSHPAETTARKVSPGMLRGQGCVMAAIYGPSLLPRLLLKAWRTSRGGAISFPKALIHLSAGALAKRKINPL